MSVDVGYIRDAMRPVYEAGVRPKRCDIVIPFIMKKAAFSFRDIAFLLIEESNITWSNPAFKIATNLGEVQFSQDHISETICGLTQSSISPGRDIRHIGSARDDSEWNYPSPR
ncbi:hypothetical protein C8J57DRAFT_1247414 [Mycena rebaudengoi]|nr:hypothetical protein C8J57DRAFT_1255808 [Mycena rebaudengoi]KAJ7219613.1 hypothetical protein C8J57DRAFT_1254488 [Mycena rebaudengoi]KAJ7237169.1 hypothetical protein C8J57DRAFT_1247414 [Mycena rebaudengoi]